MRLQHTPAGYVHRGRSERRGRRTYVRKTFCWYRSATDTPWLSRVCARACTTDTLSSMGAQELGWIMDGVVRRIPSFLPFFLPSEIHLPLSLFSLPPLPP